MNRWLRPDRPLTLAHRGHSAAYPEQTMVAYRAAIDAGVDAIEADVHLTRDGHLVMLHDETLDRTTNGSGAAADRTLREVLALDAGSWFGGAFAGERIPTLDQLLDLASGSGTLLVLEAKGATHEASLAVTLAIADRLAERGELERHVISSFDQVALGNARGRYPLLDIAPDRLPEVGPLAPAAVVAQATDIGATVMQVLHTEVTLDLVRALHAADIALWAWTVNLPAQIEAARALGSDGLMGDDAAALMAAVAR